MRILLTGGRAPVTLDLARALHRAGHAVFVAESERFQLSRSSNAVERTFRVPPPRQNPGEFVTRLVELVGEHEIDVLIPTCEEIFYVARGRDRCPASCRVWVDDDAKLNRLHDKWKFTELAVKNGFTVPRSHVVRDADELAGFVGLEGEWVLKPAFSRFGHQVLLGTVERLIAARPDFANARAWVLQKYVAGREYCAYAVVAAGDVKALSVYAHDFTAGRAGVSFEEVPRPRLEAQVAAFVKNLNFTGQIAFDFIVTEDGTPHVLECNPRATSGVHLLANRGVDLARVFTAPGTIEGPVRAAFGARAMLALPMFVFGLVQIRSWSKMRAWWRAVVRSREVIFDLRDPIPALDQVVCTLALVIRGWRARLDPLSASTADIEWNGTT